MSTCCPVMQRPTGCIVPTVDTEVQQAKRGYEVVAVTGKRDAQDYLQALGAASVLLRDEISYGSKPLERIQWQGAVDNVGGDMLAWLTRTVGWWGNIASIGLAGGHELHTSVMPDHIRGGGAPP